MNDITISDGEIKKITSSLGQVLVEFIDWQENKWEIIFRNVIAFQNIGAEGEEIAELIQLAETEFSKYVEKIEEDERKISYCFISAWNNKPVLIILADEYIVNKIT